MSKIDLTSPLLDPLDQGETGVITPKHVLEHAELPDHIDTAIIFFRETLSEGVLRKCEPLYDFVAAASVLTQYVYDNRIMIARSPLGGPSAGGLIEELVAFGVKRIIACGSSGLIGAVDPSHFLIVKQAIRDEGLSHHYLAPSLYVETDRALSATLEKELKSRGLKYEEGTVWTTDAFFRETPSRVERRKDQGALAVEMECASMAAVCKYHSIPFAQVLYFSDILAQNAWSGFRDERKSLHALISDAMVDIALSI